MATTRLALVHQDGTTNVRPVNFYLCTLTTDIAAIATQAKGDLAYDGQAKILYVYDGTSWVSYLTGGPYQLLSGKDAASGYAGLDAGGLLSIAEFAAGGTWNLTSNLAINGKVLNMNSQPRCSAYNNATQNAVSGVTTALGFNSEDYNVGPMHSTSVNNSRITVPTGGDGLYYYIGQVGFPASAAWTGVIMAAVSKNGTTNLADNLMSITNNNQGFNLKVSGIDVFTAGEYIELAAYQDSGGTLAVGSTGSFRGNKLRMVKLW